MDAIDVLQSIALTAVKLQNHLEVQDFIVELVEVDEVLNNILDDIEGN